MKALHCRVDAVCEWAKRCLHLIRGPEWWTSDRGQIKQAPHYAEVIQVHLSKSERCQRVCFCTFWNVLQTCIFLFKFEGYGSQILEEKKNPVSVNPNIRDTRSYNADDLKAFMKGVHYASAEPGVDRFHAAPHWCSNFCKENLCISFIHACRSCSVGHQMLYFSFSHTKLPHWTLSFQ